MLLDILEKGCKSIRAKDPKQAVIDTLTNSNPQAKREEMGMLAIPESISFLKEKNHQYVHAYVVLYTSTTHQKWYETSYVIQNAKGSFTRQSGVYGKTENRFLIDREGLGLSQHQPYLLASGGGGRKPIEQKESKGTWVEVIGENNEVKRILKIGSSSIYDKPAGDVSRYRFLAGRLAEDSQDVASVRMIPRVGNVEEDEVQDGTVLFLGEFSSPITFEFYSSSHTLIATQPWSGIIG